MLLERAGIEPQATEVILEGADRGRERHALPVEVAIA